MSTPVDLSRLKSGDAVVVEFPGNGVVETCYLRDVVATVTKSTVYLKSGRHICVGYPWPFVIVEETDDVTEVLQRHELLCDIKRVIETETVGLTVAQIRYLSRLIASSIETVGDNDDDR